MEHLSAVVTLRQATLEVRTSLGNVRLRDGRTREDHPYRWILDLRQNHGGTKEAAASGNAAGSLIALTFATHVKGCVLPAHGYAAALLTRMRPAARRRTARTCRSPHHCLLCAWCT